ncbi:conserved hypothetical protein [Dethiosulfovibrio peptidovorans DSM 11002]|uniref:Uncharacterized protein n=1 Tax=Dethiosulfovibrio peptidovorans DSM 11002 TaxID=469381 RepID=D2Z5Z3_9BACT|nr:nickel-dependent lactate racemase [Dethiosulfovibrio peptidovorans]EFC90890.1 conserved hypothetical protein [Dethiosulfovibrio peptidovorans DSM 11002]
MSLEFTLAYGKGELPLGLPENLKLESVLEPPTPRDVSEEEIILDGLENPIDSPRLRDLLSPGETVCVVVSDVTRAWQRMSVYLPFLVDEILAGGVKEEDVKFISATGTHRSQTPEEHGLLLGDLADRFQVVDHDCRDVDSLVSLGTTSRGTPVEVNRMVTECDRLILTGAVTYHVMAGWGGGRKSILPGVASYEAIQANHVLALKSAPETGRDMRCRCAFMEDNPLHLDMDEACSMVNPDFVFNVVMGGNGRIAAAVSGQWRSAHLKGTELVNDLNGVTVNRKADVVVASAGGYPKDMVLYQSSKTVFNSIEAVRDGGTLVVLAMCDEGSGSDECFEILTGYPDQVAREKVLRERFSIPRYVGYLLADQALKANIVLVSELRRSDLEGSGIIAVNSVEEAMAEVSRLHPEGGSAYVIPHGGSVFPFVKR